MALIDGAPKLTYRNIEDALKEVSNENTAEIIGLLSHLTYWIVFGHLNREPLDDYHLKQVFIRLTEIQQKFQSRAVGKGGQLFVAFILPMILLAIRF